LSIWTALRRENIYQVDPIVAVLISLQILINSYLAVKYSTTDMYVSIVNIIFISLTVSGLILHQVFCGGIKVDMRLVPAENTAIMLSSAVGLIAVFLFQTIVFRAQGAIVLATIFEAQLFYYTASSSEETFFRYYIQTKLEQSTAYLAFFSALLSIGTTSLLFTCYHFGVYATQPYALVAVFLSSLVLCIFYRYTKRLSVAMLIHALANLSASGIFGG